MTLDYNHCTLCPRMCGVNRHKQRGYCDGGDKATVAMTMLHRWEEPPISGRNGSGAIFFSGCNLRCNYCQNREISRSAHGKEYDGSGLAEIMLKLQSQNAHNINLVTATHFTPTVIEAVRSAKKQGLKIPVVYNTSGYERKENIQALAEVVDIWLPDFKYVSEELSAKYSSAPDYCEVAIKAISEMVKHAPEPTIDENGIMQSGVIIRHLLLPSHKADTARVLHKIAELWGKKVLISLMRQYTPDFASPECDLTRRLTTYEYKQAINLALSLHLNGFTQDADSASKTYTPKFINDEK